MEIEICQISVRDLIARLLAGWADRVGSMGFGHWITEPRHVGPPWSDQNDSFAWAVLQPKLAAGGKEYAPRSSHGRLKASTEARGSSTGDTNRGNLLNLVANKSI